MKTIEEKLDTLAEFYSQKDALELRKRELLDEIQVPVEIEQIVKNGMAQQAEIESNTYAKIKAFNQVIDAEIEAIVVPDEFKSALAEIERQRNELMKKFDDITALRNAIAKKKLEHETSAFEALTIRKRALLEDVEQKTKDVYAEINKRKTDIEIEFSGKANDADENIKQLEAEIKAEVKATGKSVKGKFLHAVYVKGRVTWNTDKMDAWVVDHPFLKEARKEGEPSITLRKI